MTDAAQNIILIVYISLLLGLLVLAVAMHMLLGKQKLRIYKAQLEKAQEKLEQEKAKIRFEIQEDDLTEVADEIHDNFGQVLSSIGLNLEAIGSSQLNEHDQIILSQSVSRINGVTDELRHLARRLNGARIENKGLVECLEEELEYISLAGSVNAYLKKEIGNIQLTFPGSKSLLLFRLAQEAIANAIRHAEAKNIIVRLVIFNENVFVMTVEDDGKGFIPSMEKSGLGLMTMKKRAMLLGADFQIEARNDGGSIVSVQIKILRDECS